MQLREWLTKARDHHALVGNHIGAYYAEYNTGSDSYKEQPCCMLGALEIVTDGTPPAANENVREYTARRRRFNSLMTYMSDVVETRTGNPSVGYFSDHASDEERAAMWEAAILNAPNLEVP